MRRTPARALARERIRSLNQSAVINAIHRNGRISRTDLAAELNLSPAAITSITSDLIAAGLVVEVEVGESSTVGRKPILLGIDYDYAHALGMKVMNHAVVASLTNLNAEVKRVHTVPLPDTRVETVVGAVRAAAAALTRAEGLPEERVAGLCVSLPGVVDLEAGEVRHSELLGWHAVPLARLLGAELAMPALVENDVNALAAAHAWFGHGRDHSSFLVVTLGRGVGLGIVLGGSVYRGPRGGAGELGHTRAKPARTLVMRPEGTTLEELVCDAALLRQARAAVPGFAEDMGPDDLTRLAAAGDEAALGLLADAGACLGAALADLVNLFAPTLIVLGGEGMRNAPYLLPSAEEELHRHVFGGLAEGLELVIDTWGDDAWARGAAGLAAARFLAEAAVPIGGARGQRAGD